MVNIACPLCSNPVDEKDEHCGECGANWRELRAQGGYAPRAFKRPKRPMTPTRPDTSPSTTPSTTTSSTTSSTTPPITPSINGRPVTPPDDPDPPSLPGLTGNGVQKKDEGLGSQHDRKEGGSDVKDQNDGFQPGSQDIGTSGTRTKRINPLSIVALVIMIVLMVFWSISLSEQPLADADGDGVPDMRDQYPLCNGIFYVRILELNYTHSPSNSPLFYQQAEMAVKMWVDLDGDGMEEAGENRSWVIPAGMDSSGAILEWSWDVPDDLPEIKVQISASITNYVTLGLAGPEVDLNEADDVSMFTRTYKPGVDPESERLENDGFTDGNSSELDASITLEMGNYFQSVLND